MLVNPTGYLKLTRDVGNLRIRELEEFLIIRGQLGFICDHSNLSHMRENIRLKIQSKNSPILGKKQTYKIVHLRYLTPSLWPILTTYLVVFFFLRTRLDLPFIASSQFGPFDQRSIERRKTPIIASLSPIDNITFDSNYAWVDCTTRS